MALLDDAGEYERLAQDFVAAFQSRDEAALARLNAAYGRAFTFEDLWAEVWRRVYAFRQRTFTGGTRVSRGARGDEYLALSEAQTVIAQDAGFQSWPALTHGVATGAPPIAPYTIDAAENAIAPLRRLTSHEWDELLAVMKERGISALGAQGLMTDAVLARVAKLDHVTRLDLSGSRELSDDGLLHLDGMPQLEHLSLNEYPGGKLTDRGLEVLRHLPNLRGFEMRGSAGSRTPGSRICGTATGSSRST